MVKELSRLYIKHKSDRSKAAHRANEKVEIEVRYGSAKDSKSAIRAVVLYPKGNVNPEISIIIGKDVIIHSFRHRTDVIQS